MRVRLLLVLAALGATAVSGCGGDDSGPATTTAARPTTVTIRGFLFEATLPSTWVDVSGQLADSSSAYDLAYGAKRTTGYNPNVLVVRVRSPATQREPLETTVARIRAKAKPAAGASTKPGPALRLGGMVALQDVTVGTQDGQELQKREIYARRAGTLYTVAFTSAVSDTEAGAALKTLVSSWRWTGGADTDPDAPPGSG